MTQNLQQHKLQAELVQLLHYLKDNGINAVIAGGVVRDIQHGVPFRDIDLYISCNEFDEAYKLITGELYDWPGSDFNEAGEEAYEHQCIQLHKEVMANEQFVSRFPELNLREHPIDIIGLRNDKQVKCKIDAVEIIERFNIGLNQCAFELFVGQGCGVSTMRYTRDRDHNTITVLREDWGQEGTKKAVRKIKAKYPSHHVQFEDGRDYDWDVI